LEAQLLNAQHFLRCGDNELDGFSSIVSAANESARKVEIISRLICWGQLRSDAKVLIVKVLIVKELLEQERARAAVEVVYLASSAVSCEVRAVLGFAGKLAVLRSK